MDLFDYIVVDSILQLLSSRLVCYIIAFCLVGGVALNLGASYLTAFIVAGVLCVPVGWAMNWLLNKLIDKVIS